MDGVVVHVGAGFHVPGGIADDRVILQNGRTLGNGAGGDLVSQGDICFDGDALLRDHRPGGNGLSGHHDVICRVQTDDGAFL